MDTAIERIEARLVRIETRMTRALIALGMAANEPPPGYRVSKDDVHGRHGPWEVWHGGKVMARCWSSMEACAWACRHEEANRSRVCAS